MSNNFTLPGNRDRITIVGATGSGKTTAALWHLSHANFTEQPFIIFDYKEDEHIGSIEGLEHIELGEIPKSPGLYAVHPFPHQKTEVDEYLMQIWNNCDVGIYVDEAYMLGELPGFLACVTQGRSRNIPMIMLAQRPSKISRFVFSECQYVQLFYLNDLRDRKTATEFARVPKEELPEYWSYYYDTRQRKCYIMRPVPGEKQILEDIDARMEAVNKTRRVYL